ncbi:type I-E CRISPR-associated protein Cas5/CasD [Streptomyces sp. NBC_01483]|uniref:type I-E CRISPR-associated protein Cas5/CasD n=1 Tax=Streptomyces sp. NBC_01483 TaxID=2903883 RepID=UPI002E3213BF|nr:type I-E CRISPR-associated protein Cas5/CasD [Streptomyces sp. NBC_01483]
MNPNFPCNHRLHATRGGTAVRGTLRPSPAFGESRRQRPAEKTSPAKYTGVTQRYYLQDAVFTAVLRGPAPLLAGLEHAVRQPVFPLSLGRRSCPPTGPVSLGLRPDAGLQEVLADVPWQASTHRRRQVRTPQVVLDATVEDPAGDLLVDDVPDTYSLKTGTVFGRRALRHLWVTIPTGHPTGPTPTPDQTGPGHDPFALLGW